MTSTNLMDASSNLMNRPADQHFATFGDLKAAAVTDQRNSRSVVLPAKSLAVVENDGKLLIARDGSGESAAYDLGYRGARAVCRLAGASPEFVFGRLTPKTASRALTEALKLGADGDVQLLLGSTTNADLKTGPVELRAITSPSYCRVWDADVYDEIDRWLLPHGFAPALPTKNTDSQRNNIHGNNKPCLFRGTDSSFAFFMHETTPVEGHGNRPVRRGVMVANSEVGLSSLTSTSMLFDDLCANFIIWGARAIKTLRIIHRGKQDAQLLRRFRTEIRSVVPQVTQVELDLLNKAAETVFASDADLAAERLNKHFGLSQANAKAALERASWNENRGLKPLTHAWVANGVTSLAKETLYADSIVELATIGGDIYAAAAGV